MGLNKIDISFHTTHRDTFDWFTQTPGTYDRVLSSIGLLREKGIEVFLKATAMTINKDDLIKMRHLAIEKFGAHFRWGPEVTPAWGGRMEHVRFRLTPEEIQRVMQDIQGATQAECGKIAV